MIRARAMKIAGHELGQVGEVDRIDPRVITHLEAGGFVPVIAPVGVGENGEAYNSNADVAAGELDAVLQAEQIIFLTNAPGVLDKQERILTGRSEERSAGQACLRQCRSRCEQTLTK